MPNGVDWNLKEIARKLLKVKIVTRRQGKEIIDTILEYNIPELQKLLKGKK